MQYAIWGVILLSAIVTFVAAYYASRTWHWANVTLVVLIFLSSVFYLVLAADVIRVHAVYGKQINRSTEELADYQARNEALLDGSDDGQVINRIAASDVHVSDDGNLVGIRDLEHRLELRTRARGPVWREAERVGVDPDTGVVTVAVSQPVPHGIEEKTILYVFEQGNPAEGRQYLGEFRVVEVGDGGVRIEPTLALDERQQERLAASAPPWALYATMPLDEYGLFQPLSEEQRRELLPAETAEEYVRHGGETTNDDDEWHRAAFNDADQQLGPQAAEEAEQASENVRYRYQRTLREYRFLFQEFAEQRVLMLANKAAIESDIAKLEEALVGAEKLRAFREDEKEKLAVDLAGMTRDRQAIERHLAQLERQIHVARTLLERTIQENAQRARQLAERQQAATQLREKQASAAGRSDAFTAAR